MEIDIYDSRQTLSGKEKATMTLFLLLSLALLASVFFMDDAASTWSPMKQEAIGELVARINDVKTKSTEDIFWKLGVKEIFDGTRVYIGEDSKAEIMVGENLIEIEEPFTILEILEGGEDQGPQFNLVEGSFSLETTRRPTREVQVGKGKSAVKLNSRTKSKYKVVIKKRNGNFVLAAKRGLVVAKSSSAAQSSVKNLQPGRTVQINQGKKFFNEIRQINLIAPIRNGEVRSSDVNFKWSQNLLKNDKYRLYIYSVGKIGRPIAIHEISGKSFTKVFPVSGAFFWEIRDKNRVEVTSKEQFQVLLPGQRIELKEPSDDKLIKTQRLPLKLKFDWYVGRGDARYLYIEKEFQDGWKRYRRYNVENRNLPVFPGIRDYGSYRWRVLSANTDRFENSYWSRFSIYSNNFKNLGPYSPRQGELIKRKYRQPAKIIFEWTDILKRSQRLQVSKKSSFSEILIDVLDYDSSELKIAKDGRYFWRVVDKDSLVIFLKSDFVVQVDENTEPLPAPRFDGLKDIQTESEFIYFN